MAWVLAEDSCSTETQTYTLPVTLSAPVSFSFLTGAWTGWTCLLLKAESLTMTSDSFFPSLVLMSYDSVLSQ